MSPWNAPPSSRGRRRQSVSGRSRSVAAAAPALAAPGDARPGPPGRPVAAARSLVEARIADRLADLFGHVDAVLADGRRVSPGVGALHVVFALYSLETRFDRDSGREAPSTLRRARAPLRGRAGHRACGQRPRGRAVAASAGSGQALQSVKRNASGTRNFRVAPRLLPVSVVRGYCWRPSQK